MAEVKQLPPTYEFDVQMTCGGCSGAINRVLKRAQDKQIISSFEVSLEEQKVIVKGNATYDTVLEMIKKTGKTVRSGKTVTGSTSDTA